ncbi:MAG TPA: TonB-dependent receptor [Candidatus Limnocylindrales bacterium]|nr:TonB-dependent receptor [Candidatus Limnocylindrales bacterium]
MRGIIRVALLVSLVAGLLFSSRIHGQGGATGAMSGTVVDLNGGTVADADVQIINAATGLLVRKLSTAMDGSFVTALLPPGTYYVVVNKSGFSEAKASGIEVRVTETTRLSITLKPGTISEKVEISAQVATVETTNATTGQTIGEETVRDLPLATQNYQQLLTLSTGAYSELNASAQLGRGTTKVFVNGQREDNNNYLIEGISATDYNVAQNYYVPLPNPDVIQEFKVQTSLYDATQGRNGGANVNAVLRGGTRELHGDVYEFFRNDALNANEYFHNATGQSRPPVKQNIFGGSLGGPVVKEKLGYFFVNYQGTRQRSALSPGTQISNPGLPALPTQRDATSIADAFSTASAPITPAMIDPVILKLLQAKGSLFGDANGFLMPSVPGATPDLNPNKASYVTAPFLISKTGSYTDDQFTSNWDREFNGSKDKLSARFFFSNSETYLPFGAGGLQASLGGTLSSSISATDLDFPYDIPVAARFFSINETHLFSPTLVNDLRFGYVRMNYSLLNNPPVTVTDLGIDRPTNNLTQSIYKFTLTTSGFQIGPTPPANQYQTQNNFDFVDNVSWIRGAHDFRFGGEFTRVNLDKDFPQTFNGQLFFVNQGNYTDWQNFLMGAPAFSFGGGGVYNHEYRSNIYSAFAQDDWKATHNLTLNLGLRVEINGAFYDKLCHIGNIDESLAAANEYPMIYGGCANHLGVPGLTGSGSDTTFKNAYATGLAPRIGLAYDLGGHRTTTVRAGYGIYYVREDVGTADQLSFQAPYLPITFGALNPGCLNEFFSPNAPPSCWPAGATSSPNALPAAGKLDPNFIPCQAAFLGFPGGDTTQAGQFGCAAGSPGSIPTPYLFVLAVPRNFVTPSTQQWNLTLQRELGKQWVLEVGYVGTHATHLRETRTNLPARLASPTSPITVKDVNGNSYQITENTTANGPMRSPYPAINGYGGFQIFANDAYSHYHSLQTTVSRRWSHGYFQGSYTFSKSTDATSSGNTALNTAFNDESDLKNSRGPSDFDRPHRLAVSYRYDLPFFSGAEGWKRTALAGWAISGISILQSGTPFTVFDSAAGTAYLAPGYTPTLTGNLVPGTTVASSYTTGGIHSRLNGYLNVNDFSPAPLLSAALGGDGTVTTFGNLGRNAFRGPFQQNWDFSLMKSFTITERINLRFSTDFFNVWNHANFASPSITDVETITHDASGNPTSDGPFGKIFSTTGTPRLIQFSLRLAF